MIEKFSDYESAGYLAKEGDFVFEVKSYELKDSKTTGEAIAVFKVESPEGKTTLYHSLAKTARWSYNNLIKACFNLDTREKIETFECDYETIGRELVGKKFMGHVVHETYTKNIKVPQDDGTFIDGVEEKDSYKIKAYDIAK